MKRPGLLVMLLIVVLQLYARSSDYQNYIFQIRAENNFGLLYELLREQPSGWMTANILEMLAPQIEGFPIAIKASGDLDTRNYRQALQTVREWFEANKDYKILSE